jgi:hypothetical protein
VSRCCCAATRDWLTRMLASAVMPDTTQAMWSSMRYSFSLPMESSSLDVTSFSAASTTPSLARIPSAAPACEIASIAYSTWYRRPSGEKVVVRPSYRRAWRDNT